MNAGVSVGQGERDCNVESVRMGDPPKLVVLLKGILQHIHLSIGELVLRLWNHRRAEEVEEGGNSGASGWGLGLALGNTALPLLKLHDQSRACIPHSGAAASSKGNTNLQRQRSFTSMGWTTRLTTRSNRVQQACWMSKVCVNTLRMTANRVMNYKQWSRVIFPKNGMV